MILSVSCPFPPNGFPSARADLFAVFNFLNLAPTHFCMCQTHSNFLTPFPWYGSCATASE